MKKAILIFLLCLFSLPGFAHPGLVDETGGHVDQVSGEYHHHGEPSFDTPYVEHVHNHESYPVIGWSLLLIFIFVFYMFYKKRKSISNE